MKLVRWHQGAGAKGLLLASVADVSRKASRTCAIRHGMPASNFSSVVPLGDHIKPKMQHCFDGAAFASDVLNPIFSPCEVFLPVRASLFH